MARACAMIVAAGLSSRMGKLKALLPVGGEPMIRLTAKKLLEAGAEEIVAVTGYRREEIEAALAGLPVRFAHNENYAVTQMFDSVKLGLRAVPEEYGRCRVRWTAPLSRPIRPDNCWKSGAIL